MRWTAMPRWREISLIAAIRSPDERSDIRDFACGVPGYRCAHPGHGRNMVACSSHRLPRRSIAPTARDVQKHLFQRGAVVAGHDGVGRVVVLDAAALHDDDAVAKPFDLEHVVRGEQDGGIVRLAVGFEM